MSENKYCGNCKHFTNEDVDGYGWCSSLLARTRCGCGICGKYEEPNNGWTEITPDNVKELYKTLNRVVIAHIIPDTIIKDVVAYEKPNELYRSLEIIAAIGGYYYYVLPELKIDNEQAGTNQII